jgi:hypothetical protein
MRRIKRITRRDALKLTASSVTLLGLGGRLGAVPQSQAPKMNVVLFMTDQERAIQHFPVGWERQNLISSSSVYLTP